MSILTYVKKNMDTFTLSEKKIATFILNNPSRIPHYTTKEFSESSETSEASLVRFCKKIGYKGFKEFKLELLREISTEQKRDFNIVKKENIEPVNNIEILHNAIEQNKIAVEKVLNTISIKELDNGVEAILRAKRIACYGSGTSSFVADDLTHKLTKLGIATFFNKDFHYMLSLVLNLEKGDVFIAISTTGNTQEVLDLVEIAKEREVTIISITTLKKSKLVKESSIVLSVPILEEDFRVGNMATRISQLSVIDVIYMCLYNKMKPNVIEKYYELRDIVIKYRRD